MRGWVRLVAAVRLNAWTRHVSYGPKLKRPSLPFLIAISCFAAIQALTIQARAADSPAKQGQRVEGTVKDALGRPLSGVQLLLTGDGHIVGRAQSGRNGTFEFRDVPRGTYELVSNKGGFRTGVEVVAVTSQGATNLDIALEAETALSVSAGAKCR
jgi:Carboxypeptidase regulatory-like domain